MRGMGETSAPAIDAYDVNTICKDLIGLLDHVEIEKAVFVGLDFGAFAIYDLALRFPERVVAVIGLENPAAPHNPLNLLLKNTKKWELIIFFILITFVKQLGVQTKIYSNE